MKHFVRALPLVFRHRLALVGIVVTSVLVAILWGANIGTIYPFVEVVIQNKAVPDWVREQAKEADRNSADLRAKIRKLQSQKATASETKRTRLDKDIARFRSRLDTEQQTAKTMRQYQPYADRYLPGDPFQTLIAVAVFLVVGTCLKCICLVINAMLLAHLSQCVTIELRRQLYTKLLDLDVASLQDHRTGSFIHRMTNEVNRVVKGIMNLLGRTIREPLKMLVCVIGAAWISWQLLLVTMLITPLAFVLMAWLSRLIKDANRQLLKERTKFFDRLTESFGGVTTIKVFTMESYERSRFFKQCVELYRRSMRLSWLGSLLSPNNELLGIGVICLAILAGGYLVLYQETHILGIRMTNEPLSIAGLMAFYAFMVGVADPVRKMSGLFGSLQGAAVASERMYEVMDCEPQIADPPDPEPLPDAKRDLILDNVSFHYEAGKPVLRDVSLRVPFGESLAIVGPNGCGKSTLASLILRLYDPVEGALRLDYTDLRKLRLKDLRRHTGTVAQNTWLFDDSVMNNIRYGSPDATDEEVVEAAKKAHAHRFILEDLSNGYESLVGERGGQISGGQRQRIALARAILRAPDLLILDEATSQIDPESEVLIHQALEKFIHGRTAIIITHRMSTLSLADRILVMDAGRIVDLGTHDELIGRCGLYQRLYQVDFRESA